MGNSSVRSSFRRSSSSSRRGSGGSAGGTSGSAGTSASSNEAAPLVARRATFSYNEDGECICPLCIGDLNCAQQFTLPECGHTFHCLCLATVMQLSSLCPVCRAPVDRRELQPLVAGMQADTKGAALLVAELQGEDMQRATKAAGGRSPAAESSVQAMVDELQRTAEGGGGNSSLALSLLETAAPAEVRMAAVQAVHAVALRAIRVNPEAEPGGLTALLGICTSDHDDDVRLAALWATKSICKRGTVATLQAVGAILQDRGASQDAKTLAADLLQAVALYNQEESKRVALTALVDDDISVRSVALATLRSVCPRGDKGVIKDLGGIAAGHSSEDARCSAMDAIASIEEVGGDYGLHVLMSALRDRCPEVRLQALAALRRLAPHGSEKVVRHIASLISGNSVDSELHAQLIGALRDFARRGDAAAVCMALEGITSERDMAVREAALATLRELSVRGDAAVIEPLLRCAQSHEDQEVRTSAIQALGSVVTNGNAEAVAFLKSSKNARNELSYAAEQALLQIR
eukprot:TRINITY_DN20415_c0_g1_i2.p1 TRINITY_DN20415_c0_g1~~TRINITY_DN20415_c0_g1_i2.p1  ORF type:complete len:551 (+),score=105.20 TRINITY_DN20415_c0_g1_i2:95-1654(+)